MYRNRLQRIDAALRAVQATCISALRHGDGRGLSQLQMVTLWELELTRAGVIDSAELATPVAFEIDNSQCIQFDLYGRACGCVLHIKAVRP